MESVVKRVDGRAWIAAALHARDVESVTLRMIADRQSERQCVFDYYRVTANVRFFSHPAELMYAGVRADVCPILDHDVAGESSGIGHNHAIADQTIVRDVRLGHDQA